MDKSRKYKNDVGTRMYQLLRNNTNRKCKAAKKESLKYQCSDIEQKIIIGKVDLDYRKIRKHFEEMKPTSED